MLDHQPLATNADVNRRWFLPVVTVAFIAFWFFAWMLERIDLAPVLTTWWQAQLPFLPLPGVLIFIVEMLHPRVLRHLLPPIVGWMLAYYAAIHLVKTLYDLPDRQTAQQFLNRLRNDGVPAGAAVSTQWHTLQEDRANSIILRVGGPGMVKIGNGDAGATELNGRFHRVIGPGGHTLQRFETVYGIVDLRQQERTVTDIPLLTRDGIEVTADVHISFRIRQGGDLPTRSHPFPFDEEAVRQAVYAESILPDGTISNWRDIPLGQTRRLLPRIVARYPLDSLLHPSSTIDPNIAVRDDLSRQLRMVLQNSGIELTSLHVGRLELPEIVSQQYIDFWKSHLDSQIRIRQAESEAFALEEKEIARIEAEANIMNAIVEGIRRARMEGHHGDLREIVALRLVDALEKMARQSQETYPLPTKLLPQLQDLRQSLGITAPTPLEDEEPPA